MIDRLSNVPPLVFVGFAIVLVAVLATQAVQRLARHRLRDVERQRRRQELGYDWSWREFWFAPRQRKLPPPPRDRSRTGA